MKKVLIMAAAVILMTGCGGGKYSDEAKTALEAARGEWTALYEEYEAISGKDAEDWIKITNTKIWVIKNTKTEEFRRIDYIVEFEIENNIGYEGFDTVALYNDGRVTVMAQSPFDMYTARTGKTDYYVVVDDEVDLGRKYNGKIDLDRRGDI